MADKKRCPILVLGIGNILLRDEGVGVRVVERLQQMDLSALVEVVDGGTAGADLLNIIAERQKVIVVDAVDIADADIEPATILRFDGDELARSDTPDISLHDLGIAETLAMTKMLGCAPESVVFIGVKPADLQPGLELSKPIANAMEKIIKRVLDEISAG
jgi:hydrogenase maturation protease